MKGLVLGGGLKVKKKNFKKTIPPGTFSNKKSSENRKNPTWDYKKKKKSFENRKQSHLGHSQIKKALRTEKIPPGIIKKKKRALKIENNPTWDILK